MARNQGQRGFEIPLALTELLLIQRQCRAYAHQGQRQAEVCRPDHGAAPLCRIKELVVRHSQMNVAVGRRGRKSCMCFVGHALRFCLRVATALRRRRCGVLKPTRG